MEELKLEIISPNEGQFLKKIGWNKDEIKKAVISITEQYKGLAYTEEQLQEAKKDRAMLNAMKKDISDRRIQVKKALLEPYDVFESEVKEVVALIDEPIEMIGKQIEAYEDKVREEKNTALAQFFSENIGELSEVVSYDRIFNPKWLNKTASLSSCKAEIQKIIDDINTDLAAIISSVDEKYQVFAKDYYLQHGFNLSKALGEANRIQEMDKKAEADRKAREEAERQREEARKEAERAKEEARKAQEEAELARKELEREKALAEKEQAEKQAVFEEANVTDVPVQENNVPVNENVAPASKGVDEEDTKIYKSSFVVRGTKAQLLMLKQYMIDNGIEFGKVEN
jgi:hypothetical protein|nr:MAG TPA: Protein of unknown function (DUF1351) [Caudoviricetes sp.]